MIISWPDHGNLVKIRFDATPSETHMMSATVTEHPVEVGAPIADNVKPGAFKITVEVVITNTPLSLSADDDSFTDGIKLEVKELLLPLDQQSRIITGAMGSTPATVARDQALNSGRTDVPYSFAAQVLQPSSQFDRVRRIYETLLGLVGSENLITVQTSLALYDQMAILSLSIPRSAEMGKAIKFSMDCQQVRTVQTETITTPAPRHQPKKAGRKPNKEEKEEKLRSYFKNIVAGLFG